VSDRFDFDSVRVGIQGFSADVRGFLFLDNQLGVRLYGNRDNNLWQYNVAWFRRLHKDTISGLNSITEPLRNDDVFVGNLYRQDFPMQGFNSQATVVYNRNREGRDVASQTTGSAAPTLPFLQPHDYDVGYIGYNGDGHIGRLNLTASAYYAYGKETSVTGPERTTDIQAWFAAAEGSVDFDWIRVRFSGLLASGDDNPNDDVAEGFDAIFENPLFAGGDTSFWVREALPSIGGSGRALSGRNSLLPSMRSSKEMGQSNFTNPGLRLFGLGADFDLLPELRVSANVNKLYFDETAVLQTLSGRRVDDDDIGWDLSVAMTYRPFMSQNVVLRVAAATLLPGDGMAALYGDEPQYSVLGSLVLTY
jgi:hypothetical protein